MIVSWKLTLVKFRKRGNLKDTDSWFYDNNKIEVVDRFSYIGVVIIYNGTFNITQKTLANQSLKAMFGFRRSTSDMSLNVETGVIPI